MKATYDSLIERFTLLYKEVAIEIDELNEAYSTVSAQKRGMNIVFSEEKKIRKVLKEIELSLLPFLEEESLSSEDKQLVDISYYISNCQIYLCQAFSSNLVPTVLTESLNILLERITHAILVWKLKIIFLTCEQNVELEDYKDILIACGDNASKIATLIK